MSTLEDEIKELRDKNNELVQKVQHWKMSAAQKENEKLELMKENHELRLKLGRLRSTTAAQSRKLEQTIQAASEEALKHLVHASNSIARNIEETKIYMRDNQEINMMSPRWSQLSGTPTSEKVQRVPPMMMGGKFIQPVVSLSRYNNDFRPTRTVIENPTRNMPLPMHMLQDLYIPLTRIDTSDGRGAPNNMDGEDSNDTENSMEDMPLENSREDDMNNVSQNASDDDQFQSSARLEVVPEDESEDIEETQSRPGVENPLEGPSWLLDMPRTNVHNGVRNRSRGPKRVNLEPDSTTQTEESALATPPVVVGNSNNSPNDADGQQEGASAASPAAAQSPRFFSPTVRRRKHVAMRTPPSPPPLSLDDADYTASPIIPTRQIPQKDMNRVLKVLVSRLERAEGGGAGDEASPPKRPLLFDAPSPNGATVSGVIVSEASVSIEELQANISRRDSRESRLPLQADQQHNFQHSADLISDNRDSGDHQDSRDSEVVRVSGNDSSDSDCDLLALRMKASKKPDSNKLKQTHRLSREARVKLEELSLDGLGEQLRTDRGSNKRSRNKDGKRSTQSKNRVHDDVHDNTGESQHHDSNVMDVGRTFSIQDDTRNSDSGGVDEFAGRSRRSKKPITYKEKSLRGKMRR